MGKERFCPSPVDKREHSLKDGPRGITQDVIRRLILPHRERPPEENRAHVRGGGCRAFPIGPNTPGPAELLSARIECRQENLEVRRRAVICRKRRPEKQSVVVGIGDGNAAVGI